LKSKSIIQYNGKITWIERNHWKKFWEERGSRDTTEVLEYICRDHYPITNKRIYIQLKVKGSIHIVLNIQSKHLNPFHWSISINSLQFLRNYELDQLLATFVLFREINKQYNEIKTYSLIKEYYIRTNQILFICVANMTSSIQNSNESYTK
jgi:hypothetical protein